MIHPELHFGDLYVENDLYGTDVIIPSIDPTFIPPSCMALIDWRH